MLISSENENRPEPLVLVISGLDPTGGAGLLADCRILFDLNCRAIGVATALTVQSSGQADSVNPVDAETIKQQLSKLISEFGAHIQSIKIGMIANQAQAQIVAMALDRLPHTQIVWDPVFAASAGLPLFDGNPLGLATLFAKRKLLITPNAGELHALTGVTPEGAKTQIEGAKQLQKMGFSHVLSKGGHVLEETRTAVDILLTDADTQTLTSERVHSAQKTHGTGCVLSSAIAARLAHGDSVFSAVSFAKQELLRRLKNPAWTQSERALLV